MTVYVDNAHLEWRGKNWCHLVADSVAELHEFATTLGLKREWFQEKTMYPHYDVTVTVQQRALALGALIGDKRTIIACAKQLRAELTSRKRLEMQQGTVFKGAPDRNEPARFAPDQQSLFHS